MLPGPCHRGLTTLRAKLTGKNEESKGLMILSSRGGSCTIVLPVEHALVLPALIAAICKEIGIHCFIWAPTKYILGRQYSLAFEAASVLPTLFSPLNDLIWSRFVLRSFRHVSSLRPHTQTHTHTHCAWLENSGRHVQHRKEALIRET